MVFIQRPQLLYLVHRVPYPPDKGDRIRTYHILKYLSERADVHLACLADDEVASDTYDALNNLCRQLAIIPVGGGRWLRAAGSLLCGQTVTGGAFYSARLRNLVRDWATKTSFDAALVSSSAMALYLQRDGFAKIPTVVDLIDVDSQKWFDYAAVSRGWRRWLYRTEGRRLRDLECSLAGWARAITLVSPAEADLYRGFSNWPEVHAVTNGVDLDYFHFTPGAKEASCVFVGALDYRPNVDAVCWFCQEVWPKILQCLPDARLSLIGRRPVAEVKQVSTGPGIELLANVPDVRPYLEQAAAVVVPLRLARGVQNKVLEALAMGKAVVASPPALTGIQARPDEHLLAASTCIEWCEAVLRLFHDSELRQRLGDAGRRYVENHHRWENCLQPLVGLLGLAS